MPNLIATRAILYGSRLYHAGDFLPLGTPLQADWLKAQSAAWEEEDATPEEIAPTPKAQLAAAPPGRPGIESGAETELMGKVPERRRPKGKAAK